MSRPRKPWINWQKERTILDPVLSARRGVIRVQASPTGPLVEFAAALRSHLDHDPRQWTTVQFDAENSRTRYFGEMLRQAERSFGIEASVSPPVSLGAATTIGSDLKAHTISIENSFNFGSGEYEQVVALEERAHRIVERVRKQSEQEACCVLFLESERFVRRDLELFNELLWVNQLDRVSGVVLVDLTRAAPRTDVTWPPPVSANMVLQDSYGDDSRANAIADLADILLSLGMEKTPREASAYSRAMLDSHDTPAAIYAQLAAILVRRQIGV